MAESVRVKSFDLVAQDICEVDLQSLHALSIGVGWPHRPADWQLLRRVGQGIAAVDGIGRVFGSAMWFPHGEDFATIGLVITTPRAQAHGAGRWLMEQVMTRCDGRNLSLNSTKAAYPLYMSLGFEVEATVFLHDGIVPRLPTLPAANGVLSELSVDRVNELTGFDTLAFGTERRQLLSVLSEVAVICVLRRNGTIVGYAMRRRFGRGHVVGPIVALNDEDAIHLTAWHLRALEAEYTRIDTRESGLFPEYLTKFGLDVSDTTTTMSKGRKLLNRTPDEPWIYGLAGHALN